MFAFVSGGEFAAIIELPRGTHQFKYLVDGNWIHDPNQVVIVDLKFKLLCFF